MVEDARGEGDLGMQGVGGDDAPAQGEMGQEFLGHGNLVRFVADPHLHERLLRRVRGHREQLRGRLRGGTRATHDFAIERDGFAIAQGTRLLDPTCQRPFDMDHREPGQ